MATYYKKTYFFILLLSIILIGFFCYVNDNELGTNRSEYSVTLNNKIDELENKTNSTFYSKTSNITNLKEKLKSIKQLQDIEIRSDFNSGSIERILDVRLVLFVVFIFSFLISEKVFYQDKLSGVLSYFYTMKKGGVQLFYKKILHIFALSVLLFLLIFVGSIMLSGVNLNSPIQQLIEYSDVIYKITIARYALLLSLYSVVLIMFFALFNTTVQLFISNRNIRFLFITFFFIFSVTVYNNILLISSLNYIRLFSFLQWINPKDFLFDYYTVFAVKFEILQLIFLILLTALMFIICKKRYFPYLNKVVSGKKLVKKHSYNTMMGFEFKKLVVYQKIIIVFIILILFNIAYYYNRVDYMNRDEHFYKEYATGIEGKNDKDVNSYFNKKDQEYLELEKQIDKLGVLFEDGKISKGYYETELEGLYFKLEGKEVLLRVKEQYKECKDNNLVFIYARPYENRYKKDIIYFILIVNIFIISLSYSLFTNDYDIGVGEYLSTMCEIEKSYKLRQLVSYLVFILYFSVQYLITAIYHFKIYGHGGLLLDISSLGKIYPFLSTLSGSVLIWLVILLLLLIAINVLILMVCISLSRRIGKTVYNFISLIFLLGVFTIITWFII